MSVRGDITWRATIPLAWELSHNIPVILAEKLLFNIGHMIYLIGLVFAINI